MSIRVVLIPFLVANSEEHITSTKGGTREGPDLIANWNAQIAKHSGAIPALENYAKNIPSKAAEIQKAIDDAKANISNWSTAVAQRQALESGWRDVSANDIVCRDSPNLAGTINRLHDKEDTLYIRGHCDEGASELASSDQRTTITVEDLVALLEGKLDKLFPGRIKIFACNSAKDLISNDSFAYQFADLLAKKGWVNARVLGYTQSLRTFISDLDGYKSTQGGGRATAAQKEINLIRAPTSCCLIQ